MHDVGKIAIPDRILRKPGPLTTDERGVMQRHAEVGADLLAGSRSPSCSWPRSIARTHHERWDGTGYPAGLAGEEIPLAGRICAICDVFDALVSRAGRTSRRGRSTPRWTRSASSAAATSTRGLVDLFLELAPKLERELAPPVAARTSPRVPVA